MENFGSQLVHSADGFTKVGTLKLCEKGRNAGIPLKISLLLPLHLDGQTLV